MVADDDVLLREGLVSLLDRSGFDVVGSAGDATELLALCRRHRPELVVVDIRMPPDYTLEGLRAARVIDRHRACDVAALGEPIRALPCDLGGSGILHQLLGPALV